MRDRATTLLIVATAVLVAAGGFIHLREWLDTYRYVPASAPGSVVVRVGFPANAAASLAIGVALLAAAYRLRRYVMIVVAGAIAFEAASLGSLILSRTGSVLGWREPVWTHGANQARLVEVLAAVALGGVVALNVLWSSGPSYDRDDR